MLSDEELRELVERELREDIERRFRDGESREEVVTSLIDEGFVPETARTYVDAACEDGEADSKGHWVIRSALATCVLIAVALVLLALRA